MMKKLKNKLRKQKSMQQNHQALLLSKKLIQLSQNKRLSPQLKRSPKSLSRRRSQKKKRKKKMNPPLKKNQSQPKKRRLLKKRSPLPNQQPRKNQRRKPKRRRSQSRMLLLIQLQPVSKHKKNMIRLPKLELMPKKRLRKPSKRFRRRNIMLVRLTTKSAVVSKRRR